jgi:hypothetical protein
MISNDLQEGLLLKLLAWRALRLESSPAGHSFVYFARKVALMNYGPKIGGQLRQPRLTI